MRILCCLMMCFIGMRVLAQNDAEIALPGEKSEKPALGCEPFPSRLHAFVWKNWTVVPQERLAAVLKTTPENVVRVAASMGLPPQKKIQQEWKNKGYITVLRRNWHLLPYDQLMHLLEMSRTQLRYSLMEDDFLFVKLGNIKPKCEPLLYAPPTPAEETAAARLAGWLREEVGDTLTQPEEPRFSFIVDLSGMDPALKNIKSKEDSKFELRFIFSYFADYGDPLLDPEVGSYPDGLLQKLAASGVNGVWVHTVLNTLSPSDTAFPEFGKDHEKRIAGLRTLVDRAKKYGIDVFLYMNEPRAMHERFFEARPERAGMRGVRKGENCALCTSNPEVRRWMSDTLAFVFSQVPGLGGVFTITASENLTSCASHRQQANCERCKARTYADIIAEVNTTIAEGVARGNPAARVIVWDWGWDDKCAADIISKLPKSCWFMSVSEWSLPIERGGVKSNVGEYSLSAVGPGPRATAHWSLARAAGLKTVAKVQTSTTWEFCAIPYMPVMDLVAEHGRNLLSAGVNGLMLSWSLGGYPSPNLQVFQSFTDKDQDTGMVLDRVAEKCYGKNAAPLVRKAWTAFSDGFREYPYHISTLYNGPQHIGPANPLYMQPTGYSATMVGLPYDDLKAWRSIYPADVWISQMERVYDGFSRGCAVYDQLVDESTDAVHDTLRSELAMFRAATLHFISCANQARFVQARDELYAATNDVVRLKCRTELRKIVLAELKTAKQLLPLVKADSRIGYESSNQYFYIPQDIIEKIVSCRSIIAWLDQEDRLSMDSPDAGSQKSSVRSGAN